MRVTACAKNLIRKDAECNQHRNSSERHDDPLPNQLDGFIQPLDPKVLRNEGVCITANSNREAGDRPGKGPRGHGRGGGRIGELVEKKSIDEQRDREQSGGEHQRPSGL